MWRNALVLRFTVIFMFSAVFSAVDARRQEDEVVWMQLKEWVISHHGMVHPGLKSNMTYHRGFPVRGIISTESIWSWTSVLTIPRNLWIDRDTFAETKAVSLPDTEVCRRMHAPTDGDALKFVAGLALENKKGSDSFYYPWLRSLPSFADFHSFLPRLMEPTVRSDFAVLPFVTAMVKAQEQDMAIKQCFEAWQTEPNSLVGSVPWQDISTMLSTYRTRALDGGGMPFMIPAMDLLNTENADKATVHWDIAIDAFTLSTEFGGLHAGAELTEEYCPGCSNFELMAIWGIYLEDNLNDLQDMDTSFCHSNPSSGGVNNFTGSRPSASLRQVTEAMLDIESLSLNSNWRAPRCQTERVMALEQGPLRCSLARLAWEQCHAEWNARSSVNMMQPKVKPKLRGTSNAHIDDAFVTLLSQSFIGAVHPKLLPPNITKSTQRQPNAGRRSSRASQRSIVQGGMMLSSKRVL